MRMIYENGNLYVWFVPLCATTLRYLVIVDTWGSSIQFWKKWRKNKILCWKLTEGKSFQCKKRFLVRVSQLSILCSLDCKKLLFLTFEIGVSDGKADFPVRLYCAVNTSGVECSLSNKEGMWPFCKQHRAFQLLPSFPLHTFITHRAWQKDKNNFVSISDFRL